MLLEMTHRKQVLPIQMQTWLIIDACCEGMKVYRPDSTSVSCRMTLSSSSGRCQAACTHPHRHAPGEKALGSFLAVFTPPKFQLQEAIRMRIWHRSSRCAVVLLGTDEDITGLSRSPVRSTYSDN